MNWQILLFTYVNRSNFRGIYLDYWKTYSRSGMGLGMASSKVGIWILSNFNRSCQLLLAIKIPIRWDLEWYWLYVHIIRFHEWSRKISSRGILTSNRTVSLRIHSLDSNDSFRNFNFEQIFRYSLLKWTSEKYIPQEPN